jgi:molybdenum cofactor cytidylyltransferase
VIRVAAIVLAAGGSSRMGSPKQLLRLGGESLVRRAATTALASHCSPVIVVVGAEAESVSAKSRICRSNGSRTFTGRRHGQLDPRRRHRGRRDAPTARCRARHAADQPAVTALLDQLVAAAATAPAGLVACEYAGTIGAPALFASRHFDALRRLSGDRGGKALLAAHRETVVLVPFAPAAIDVDTPDDYRQVRARMEAITPPSPWRRARDRA